MEDLEKLVCYILSYIISTVEQILKKQLVFDDRNNISLCKFSKFSVLNIQDDKNSSVVKLFLGHLQNINF